MNESNNEPNPKVSTASSKKTIRRFFRFSLRSMLLVMTIFSVWLFVQVESAKEQKKAVAWIRSKGSQVRYEYEPRDWNKSLVYGNEPEWLRRFLGVDFFYHVDRAIIKAPKIMDFSKLTSLSEMKLLIVFRAGYTAEEITQLQKILPDCEVRYLTF